MEHLSLREGRYRFVANVVSAFFALSMILNLLLGFTIWQRNERIVVCPPQVQQEFWVSGSEVSRSYLEQMSCYLSQALLSKSPASANHQSATLLSHVAPEFYGSLARHLDSELDSMRENGASFTFFPEEVKGSPSTLTAAVVGELRSFAGSEEADRERLVCELSFRIEGGRLLITDVHLEPFSTWGKNG